MPTMDVKNIQQHQVEQAVLRQLLKFVREVRTVGGEKVMVLDHPQEGAVEVIVRKPRYRADQKGIELR